MKADNWIDCIKDEAASANLNVYDINFIQERESDGVYSISYYGVINDIGNEKEVLLFNTKRVMKSAGAITQEEAIRRKIRRLKNKYQRLYTPHIQIDGHHVSKERATATIVSCDNCNLSVKYDRSDNQDIVIKQLQYSLHAFIINKCE